MKNRSQETEVSSQEKSKDLLTSKLEEIMELWSGWQHSKENGKNMMIEFFEMQTMLGRTMGHR